MKLLRVKIDHEYDPLVIDVLTDEDHFPIPDSPPTSGWWGRLGTTNLLPFILQPSGRLDFGSDENTDQADRYALTDIKNVHIRPGERVTVDDGQGVLQWPIISVTQII